MQLAIKTAKNFIHKNESYIRSFKNSVYWVAQNIDDYEKLKMSVLSELKFYVQDHNQKVVVEDSEIQQENKVQMQFLKKSVDALHNKLNWEKAEHAKNRISVMEINQSLIGDISNEGGLKASIERLKVDFNALGGSKKLNEIMKKTAERDKLLDYIDQQENGAAQPSSNRSLMAADPNSSQ